MTTIGKNGRLGNQMFQFAALKGIAKNRKLEYILLPSKEDSEYEDHKLLSLFEMKDVPVGNINPMQRISQKDFGFDENLFNHCPDNVDIYGYFQTEKFFAHIRNDLVKDFTFKDASSMTLPVKNYVSIHVRRGDYLLLQDYHPPCSMEYYKNAMSFFSNNHFVVVSDDIEWCKQQKEFVNCEFWEGESIAHDLYVMTKAEHNIIANSSFSWWGAWLNQNPNKIVVAPKKWFGEKVENNTEDIIPTDWIRV
jgi:hypothetical protein